jgi:hypothetical protein
MSGPQQTPARARKKWIWSPERRAAHSVRLQLVWAQRDGVKYAAMADPEKGLGYLDRSVDVPRTFEQSVRRARDPRRRVQKGLKL